jgi:hypothetical protein
MIEDRILPGSLGLDRPPRANRSRRVVSAGPQHLFFVKQLNNVNVLLTP